MEDGKDIIAQMFCFIKGKNVGNLGKDQSSSLSNLKLRIQTF